MPRKRNVLPVDSTVAVAYLRVSTEDQRLGPEAQRDAIEKWAALEKKTIASWHTDQGVSGAAQLDKRPGLMSALSELAQRNAGLLVVAKRDRLARDILVAATIERLVERYRARIVSADGLGSQDGPEGQMIRGIMDVFAQYERAIIRARTLAALSAKRARNERLGRLPWGFRVATDGIHLEPDPDEQQAAERLRVLRAEGLSLRAVVDRMNEERWRTRGLRWHLSTVAKLLGSQP
jgi:DNA invertase Pin-like site-specific DNA recombinase